MIPERVEQYPQVHDLCWKDKTILYFLSSKGYTFYSFYNNVGFGSFGFYSFYKLIDDRASLRISTRYDNDLKKTVLERGSYTDTSTNSRLIIDDNVQYDTTMTSSYYKGVIFYNAKKDGDYDIYGYGSTSDGLNEKFKATDNTVDDMYPVISPDGTKVAYLSKTNGCWALCVMDVICDYTDKNGRNIGSKCVNHSVLVENVEFDKPVWMPNSKAIIYSANKSVLGSSPYKNDLDTYLYLYSLDHKDYVQISQETRTNKVAQIVPHRYEAERAYINHSVIAEKKEASDSRMVTSIKYEDSFVEFTVNVPIEHVDYTIQVGYFNGNPVDSTHIVQVKDVPPFEITYAHAGWDHLAVQEFSVPLKAGENKIRFTKGKNTADIDYITVLGVTEK